MLFLDDVVLKIKINDSVLFNRIFILIMIYSLSELVFEYLCLYFDDESSMDNEDYKVLIRFLCVEL